MDLVEQIVSKYNVTQKTAEKKLASATAKLERDGQEVTEAGILRLVETWLGPWAAERATRPAPRVLAALTKPPSEVFIVRTANEGGEGTCDILATFDQAEAERVANLINTSATIRATAAVAPELAWVDVLKIGELQELNEVAQAVILEAGNDVPPGLSATGSKAVRSRRKGTLRRSSTGKYIR